MTAAYSPPVDRQLASSFSEPSVSYGPAHSSSYMAPFPRGVALSFEYNDKRYPTFFDNNPQSFGAMSYDNVNNDNNDHSRDANQNISLSSSKGKSPENRWLSPQNSGGVGGDNDNWDPYAAAGYSLPPRLRPGVHSTSGGPSSSSGQEKSGVVLATTASGDLEGLQNDGRVTQEKSLRTSIVGNNDGQQQQQQQQQMRRPSFGDSASMPPPQQQQQQQPQYAQFESRPLSQILPSAPKHPSAAAAAGGNNTIGSGGGAGTAMSNGWVDTAHMSGNTLTPASPSTKLINGLSNTPISVPISATSRALAQQPTYITPPSSPTPIVVNPIYSNGPSTPYTPDPMYPSSMVQQQQQQSRGGAQNGRGLPPPIIEREICVECAMRDQDMADVDVTSPGIWERESDIFYQELCRKEEEEEREREMNSSGSSEAHSRGMRSIDPHRPRAKGDRLTEQNLKVWLTMNPREPQARQQTLSLYVKTQTALLEAEALARARAQQESRALDDKLRDTIDNIRRSTYDLNSSTVQLGGGGGGVGNGDGEPGVRLKPVTSPRRSSSGLGPMPLGTIVVDGLSGSHSRHHSHGREVTLLENGMIVEHVDVRKEEKERRREERKERERERSRVRKTSRGSANQGGGAGAGADVMSMYSTQSPLPHQDSGFHSITNGTDRDRPMSRISYSQSSTRAMSVLTTSTPTALPLTPPPSRPGNNTISGNGRMHSQVSLIDAQSISSASMSRRSRFFSFRNLSGAWRSQDSFACSNAAMSGMSGSMMDMHVALERDAYSPMVSGLDPTLRNTGDQMARRSISADQQLQQQPSTSETDKPKKKRLQKFWSIVTGHKSSKSDGNGSSRGKETSSSTQMEEKLEDDYPLAPPPPLSYLVNRSSSRERTLSAGAVGAVGVTGMRRISIPSTPLTPGSAATLPTPTSPRQSWYEQDVGFGGGNVGGGGGGADGRKRNGSGYPLALPAHAEEPSSHGVYLHGEMDGAKGVHPAMSVPDMRQRVQDLMTVRAGNGSSRNLSAAAAAGAAAGANLPRPVSSLSIYKNLPPLPPEAGEIRPKTMFQLASTPNVNMIPDANGGNVNVNGSSLSYRDARRSSFGGLSSRPDMGAGVGMRTVPISGGRGGNSGRVYGFDEVGAASSSGRSLLAVNNGDTTATKRRSKFGLATLFGKLSGSSNDTQGQKNGNSTGMNGTMSSLSTSDAPSSKPSESDHLGSVTEYGTVTANNARSGTVGLGIGVNGNGNAPRMSIASRKAIESLVDQDAEFVAYRYPSTDQNLALLR